MFLKIAIDHTGGSNYVHISTTQLQSVPYSMYAHKAGLLTNAAGTNFIETDRIPGIDKIRFNVADTQRWVMEKARLQPSNSGRSIFIGRLAGENDDFSENRNVFIGDNSGKYNISGAENTFGGNYAGQENVTGSYNSFYGSKAGAVSKGSYNSFFGYNAGLTTATGHRNVCLLYTSPSPRD